MSLTRGHNDIVFQCDGKGCREKLETNTSNFDAARNALRRARWQPLKRESDSDWLHFCPDCQKAGKSPERQRELV